MRELFTSVLTSGLYGSVIILAVLLFRFLARKTPGKWLCLLWLLAFLRLAMPFQIESSFSLQPDTIRLVRENESVGTVQPMAPVQTIVPAVPEDAELPDDVTVSYGDAITPPVVLDDPVVQDTPTATINPGISDTPAETHMVIDWLAVGGWVWLAGCICFCGYGLISYLRLKHRVREAVRCADGAWECAGLETAFILGFLKPRIYIPMGTSYGREFILTHERGHIARGDHWWKLLGYLVLAVHWFNPLVWAAYLLLCRDMERACDERVVRDMSLEERKAYSTALLACSADRRYIIACPVAFGEISVKARIKNVLNYKKPRFWVILVAVIAVIFVTVTLLTIPKQELLKVEIPTQSYEMSDKSYRVREKFADSNASFKNTCDYESSYAVYHFDGAISQEERDACVFYSDGILARLNLVEKPELVVPDDYSGAWMDGQYLYLGGDFTSIDYGAKLITLIYGGYANYGAAYGYADYIAVEAGWKEAADWQTHLTNNDARDLNWLCFREEFVSDEEIEINRNTAVRFAREYIAENGEAAYRQMILKSGDVEEVAQFNTALSGWYAANGLDYMPTEVLYSMGGEYHDYLVKCRYATFYLPEDWVTRFVSDLTMDGDFLHEDYADVKICFETNAYQMGKLQEAVGFDGHGDLLAVEFVTGGLSGAKPSSWEISISSIEDLPMLYVGLLAYNSQRTLLDYYLAPAMADYISVTGPNLYRGEWLRYCAKNGMQPSGYQETWNDLFTEMMEGETDPAVIHRARWDFGSYYSEDYYDKYSSGLAMSFGWYLIDKYGYETMFDFIYETENEPAQINLAEEQNNWIAYLEEKYGAYPKSIDNETAADSRADTT